MSDGVAGLALLGAGSFLGRSIYPLLEKSGVHVTCFSRRPVPFCKRWRRLVLPDFPVSLDELRDYEVIVFAVAAGVQSTGSLPDLPLLYWINAFYPLQIMSQLDVSGWKGRWISFGSYFEIGCGADKPLDEEGVLGSLGTSPNQYCATKRALSRGVAFGRWSFAVHHFILPTIYGVGEENSRIIPYVFGFLRNGQVPKLSSGTQVRQYLHTRDIGDLVLRTLAGEVRPGCFNAAPDNHIQIRELVCSIYSLFGSDTPPAFGSLETRDESMRFLALNGHRLRDVSGWSPRVTLHDGLKEYMDPKHIA